MGEFIRGQKNINNQLSQTMDHMENFMNKKFDSLQSNLPQKIDNMQVSFSKFTSSLVIQEKEMFPSQPQ